MFTSIPFRIMFFLEYLNLISSNKFHFLRLTFYIPSKLFTHIRLVMVLLNLHRNPLLWKDIIFQFDSVLFTLDGNINILKCESSALSKLFYLEHLFIFIIWLQERTSGIFIEILYHFRLKYLFLYYIYTRLDFPSLVRPSCICIPKYRPIR